MKALSKLGHTPEATKAHTETMRKNIAEHAAIDAQRDRLRTSSIVPSMQVQFDNIARPPPTPSSAQPAAKRRRLDRTFTSRLDALQDRFAKRRPTRFAFNEWRDFKLESIRLLQPYYEHSAASKFGAPALPSRNSS